jgi:hypothetical protein
VNNKLAREKLQILIDGSKVHSEDR